MSQSKVSDAILPGWLAKLARPTRMLWLGPLLGFALSIPSFFTGYKLDDYLFAQQSLDKTVYHARASWDYFNWASSATEVAQYRERGIIVDWFTPDAFRFRPFRPLASLVHAWQFRHLAHAPWAMHVSLALLYALLILLCAKLLMRFSTSATAVGIGVLLFAIDDSHAFSSGWISAYNTLLCCLFGLFALFMHDRWRRDKSSLGLTFSVASFVLALLSSEGGLALMGYLVAYAIFVESGSWRKKAASMILAVLIAAGYLLFYAMYHFGPRCFVAYVSASDDPWLAVFAVLSNTVLFTVSQVVSLAPLTAALQFSGSGGVIVAAVLFVVLVAVFRRFLASSKTAAFFATGMVLSIVPFTLGFISDRLLLWASFGGAGLLAELLTAASAGAGRLQRVSARTLLVTNTVLSLLLFVPFPFLMFSMEGSSHALAGAIPTQNTVLLNSSNGFTALYAPAIRCYEGGTWPGHFYSLYCGSDTLTVTRTGDRTLTATVPNGWIASDFERSRRPRQLHFTPGQSIDLQLMTATIEKVTCDARPLSVTFAFKEELSAFAWMKWVGKEPEQCGLPAIGGQMRLWAPLF